MEEKKVQCHNAIELKAWLVSLQGRRCRGMLMEENKVQCHDAIHLKVWLL